MAHARRECHNFQVNRDKYYIPAMRERYVMKKNTQRIRRWLDRLSSACESEKWDSALIEADCLSAEVRQTREKICDAANNRNMMKRSLIGRRQVFMVTRTTVAALLIVFAASLPSAIEADRPWSATNDTKTTYVKEDSLSWVTPEEELLLVLRSEMSRSSLTIAGAAANIQSKGTDVVKNNQVQSTVGASDSSGQTRGEKKEAADMNNEELMALVQIGERALRGNAPAVTIIN